MSISYLNGILLCRKAEALCTLLYYKHTISRNLSNLDVHLTDTVMAELKGVLKITGKLGGLSFYEMNGKIIVRTPGGFDGEKIRTDAKYVNVRNNAAEFGRCSKFGGRLRRVLQPFLKDLNDPQIHGRMAKMLHQVMMHDMHSEKGKRSVLCGLKEAEGRAKLAGFVWNLRERNSCRYDFEKRRLYFDQIPAGSTKAVITLRFIRPNERERPLDYLEIVFEVALPCAEFSIPEDASFTDVEEGILKFALIRFYDAKGELLSGKTAVVVGEAMDYHVVIEEKRVSKVQHC